MEAQITEVVKDEYSVFVSATAGKISASVSIYKGEMASLGVQIICKNASHRVWRGAGKLFSSVSEALQNYKSPEMKAIINAA
jgi:DNA-binding protein H-NS